MLISPSLNPWLPALVRICGNTLLLAFVAVVVFSVLPLQIGSPLWGSQLSSRIVDGASLALVGTTLLSAAAYLQSMPEDPDMARGKVILLNKQRLFALRLSSIGVISMALLAVWQLLLLTGSVGQISQSSLGQSRRCPHGNAARCPGGT